jgi:hypothetical protein
MRAYRRTVSALLLALALAACGSVAAPSLGLAAAGPRAVKTLAPVVHGDHLRFAWAIFEPQARIFGTR